MEGLRVTTRTNPFEPLERMFERMNDQLREAANSWESGEQLEPWMPGATTMATDVKDADEEFVVTVDVPGFGRDDIDVRVADDVLRVEAEREAVEAAEEERYVRKERTARSVHRSITFPTPVETQDVDATLTNGVLTIVVPKAEPLEEGTTIDIEAE
jgi:HSP20 family protein